MSGADAVGLAGSIILLPTASFGRCCPMARVIELCQIGEPFPG